MEIARRVSKVALLFSLSLCSLWSFTLQANIATLGYTFTNDLDDYLPATQRSAIEAFALNTLKSSVPSVSLTVKNTEALPQIPRVVFNLVRTKDNELKYHWISPIIAYRCNDSMACTPNAGSQEFDVSVAYIALMKEEGSQQQAEWLSEKVSKYKTSPKFELLTASMVSSLSADYPETEAHYGLISLAGNLQANTSNLWVISDLVPLFSDLNERGELKGIAADFVRDVLQEMEMSDTILSAPWKRIAKEATTKSNVLVFSIIRTNDRDDVFHWVTPLSRNLHGLFGINKPRFSSIEDVPKSYRVGTLTQDYRYDIAIDLGFQVKAYESWQALVDGLARNEVDVMFGSHGAVNFGCNPERIKCETITLTSEYDTSTAYLALSKTETSILVLEKLKLAAAKVRKSKIYNEQLSRWSNTVSQDFGIAHHTENGVVHLWNKN